jgi:ABC-type transport system involved in multi-copper enzyme maturation permease subunit
MRAILAITFNTYREVVRQRLFLLVLVLAAAALGVMLIMPYFLSGHEETEMYKDLALHTLALALVFLVALTASSTVAEEMESRTAMAILAKPVARWQFLVGKYLGIVVALALASAVLAVMLFIVTYLRVYYDALPQDRHLAFTLSQSEPAREFQALMWNQALTTLPGCVMVFYQGVVLAAVAVVLSSRFSRVLAVIVTFGLFLVGHLAEFLVASVSSLPDLARNVYTWLANLVPFLETFNITSKLSHSVLVPGHSDTLAVWTYTGLAGLYAAGYAAFVLLLGIALFGRREIK